MASESAWNEGWAQGREASQHRRDRKEMLSDEERQQKAGQYIDLGKTQRSDLRDLETAGLKDSQQYKDLLQSFGNTQANFNELYHPIKAPGAIQSDWHYLLGKIKGVTAPKDKTPPSAPPQASSVAVNTPAPPSITPAIPADPSVGQEAVPATTMPGMNSVPKGATPTMAVAKPKGLVEAGTIPIWNRPSVLNDDGTHSSELSISMQDDKGNQVLIPLIVGGKFLTPDGKMPPGPIPHNAQEWEKASPEWKALKMRAWQNYEKTGEHLGKFGGETAEDDVDAYAQVLHNRGSAGATTTLPVAPSPTVTKAPPVPWGQAQVLKHKAAARQKAQQEAGLLASGAPPSPQQEAVIGANATNAGELARIRGQISNYKAINPSATDEDVAAYTTSLLSGNNQIGNWERVDGTIDGQPYAVSYDKKRGVYKWPDGTISSNMPENFKPTPKTSGATAQELSDYAADTDPKKGPFVQWLATKRAQGTASVKPKSKDDRYIEINQKKLSGQSVTPDDQAFLGAYDLWTQKSKVEPGVARAAAFGAMRYVPVVSPTDPENVILMRAGDAAKAEVNTPASIGFKTDQAITRYMTTGAGGTNINYFNTATDHLRLLAEAGAALNNGDTQLFNSWANRFATATGDPAPSNFETVKAAVAGELSKTFKGTGATDSEIADINQTINQAQSPQQINGAITYYTRLMGSKIQALKSQYDAAKQGKPNFPGAQSPAGAGAGKFPVKLPNGKTKFFPTKKAADDFKTEAGIK